ncbi:hypothetical protein Glove_306g79 [Diversispora epigaea]|uniref:BTB domain-containing protein n=1 Tax=Diversispora epigaea TaxID=1348612 RepID=A0A397HZY0_9GLOM|nr:hypothetical protein Glove_306g79 [Diversispora epigaea]
MSSRNNRYFSDSDDSLSDSSESNNSFDRAFTYFNSIPSTYAIRTLHDMGDQYYQDRRTAYAELQIEGLYDNSGKLQSFYVHREYLVSQSEYFNKIFNDVGSENSLIKISIPSPDTFEPLLEYLYTGNGDKWYDSLSVDNYTGAYENIVFFGLGKDVMNIWMDFYNSTVDSVNSNA